MHLILLGIALVFLACDAAFGQSKLTFNQSGVLKIETLKGNGEQDFFYGQSDLAVRSGLGDGFAFGADLGLDSLHVKGQNGGTAYPSAVIDSPYGKLSIGIPRLVMPDFFAPPALGGSEVLGLITGLASGDWLRFMTYVEAAPTLRGLRYDVHVAKITAAAALQALGPNDRPIRSFAVTFDGGNYSMSLGRTVIDLGPSLTTTTTKIGLLGHYGPISGGVIASHQRLGDAWGNCLNGFVGYAFNDHLKIEAQVFHTMRAGGSDLAWGADVIYRHHSGVFGQAGLAQLTPQGERIVTLSVGYHF